MKLFAAAAIVLLSLASSFSYAEQTTTPVRQNQRDTMILPSNITTRRLISIIWRPAMINLTNLACRTTSSTTCDAITRILVYSPVSGAFLPARHARPHQTQTENVDIEPGHDQRRPGELQSAQRLPPAAAQRWPSPLPAPAATAAPPARFHSAPAASPRYHSRRGWR